MACSLGLDDVVTRLTQATGVTEGDLSTILLVISVVAMGGAGLGLIIVCARALLARPARPPWLEDVPPALESIHDLVEPAKVLPEERPRLEALPVPPVLLEAKEEAPVEPEPTTLRSGSEGIEELPLHSDAGETPAVPPQTPSSSGLVPAAVPRRSQPDLGSFQYGARRA
jgi:hypothetical protein